MRSRALLPAAAALALCLALAGCRSVGVGADEVVEPTTTRRPEPMVASCFESAPAANVDTAPDWRCGDDPECLAYIERVRSAVYAHWRPAATVPAGWVCLRFRVDERGSVDQMELRRGSAALAESCLRAFERAGPFGPPPGPLVGKSITALFHYRVEESP